MLADEQRQYDLQHHSVAESGDYEESLIRQEYMVAGVDRQNENEMANEQVEHVMSNELVVCNEQVEDEMATEEVKDRMSSERVEDTMASEGMQDMMAIIVSSPDPDSQQLLVDYITAT
eukprot:Em0001g2087a